MPSHLIRRHFLRRYVKLVLEELESRHVPSLLGLQIELPLSGILPPLSLSAGPGSAPPPVATTTPPTTTTTTAPPGGTSISFTFPPSGQNESPTSVTITFAPVSTVPQPTTTSDASGSGGSSASTASASSSSAFHENASQGSGSAFTFPTIAIPALGIQAAQAGSSNVLGGTVTGINFELLGNLPSLLGPSSFTQGTNNISGSGAQLLGAPYGGSVFGRLDLFLDRGTGATGAFGLMHPPLEEPGEPVPENPPTPPDDQWWISDPQSSDETLPPGTAVIREELGLPADDLPLSPDRIIPVDSPLFEVPSAPMPPGFLFSEDDLGMPDDEDQPEEQNGISPAVAILSCALGAYWAPRFRSSRRTAAVPPEKDSDK